jgi:hypothetical protein
MKKFRSKKVYLFFSAVLASMIHLPFAFSGTKAFSKNINRPIATVNIEKENSSAVYKVYDSLKLNISGLSEHAFNYAVKGFEYLKAQGKIANDNIISIADFTRPSSEKRLFVIDLKNYKVLFNTYVAHGQGSGQAMANSFSNIPESYQSSLGFYETEGTYMGKNGYSMHLAGLERGINDKAEERAIVMHGASYVSESFINTKGFLGRSWGCPAVPEQLNRPIIDKIKNGTCLFIFSENKSYLNRSVILNS